MQRFWTDAGIFQITFFIVRVWIALTLASFIILFFGLGAIGLIGASGAFDVTPVVDALYGR